MRISSFVTLPSLPEPEIFSNSAREIPSSLAIFFTNGEKNFSESEKFTGVATDSLATSIVFSIDATSSVTTTSCFGVSETELYKEYIETWIKPSLDYMENVIWDEVNKDANYLGGLSKEQLKENTNLDFYNYITCVLERLILQFIDYKQLKVKNV